MWLEFNKMGLMSNTFEVNFHLKRKVLLYLYS